MTYITIDTKSRQAQKFVELIETLPFAKILNEPDAATKKILAVKGNVPEWQKEEVRKSIRDIKEDPSILIDEDVIFDMLKND